MRRIVHALEDDRGIETLEWLVVGALIVSLALVIFPGTLAANLTGALNAIGGTIVGLAG